MRNPIALLSPRKTKETNKIISWGDIEKSARYQLGQITILLDLLKDDPYWNIAIADFLKASGEIARKKNDVVSHIIDTLEDGLCILNNFYDLREPHNSLKNLILEDFEEKEFENLDAIVEVLVAW